MSIHARDIIRHPIARLLLVLLSVTFILSALVSLSPLLGTILIAAAGAAALTTWLLRFGSAKLERIYQIGWIRPVIDQMAAWADLQPPTSGTAPTFRPSPTADANSRRSKREATASERPGEGDGDANPDLLLRAPIDFRILLSNLKGRLLGHDEVIQRLVADLERSLRLRAASAPASAQPPLCAVLLVGPEGFGKRHLVCQLAEQAYRSGAMTTIDCAGLPDGPAASAELFGDRGSPSGGRLLQAVKRTPHQTILLEHIDQCPTSARNALRQILTEGTLTDPSSGANISFRHCLIFMTTSRGADVFQSAKASISPRDEGHQQLLAALADETRLSKPLLSLLTNVYRLGALDAPTIARVLVLLMKAECRKYNLILGGAAPSLLAQEALQYADTFGLATAPARVASLLKEPILAASSREQSRVYLGLETESNTPCIIQNDRLPTGMKSIA